MPAFSISPTLGLDPIYVDLSDGKTPASKARFAEPRQSPSPSGLEPINLEPINL